MKLYEPENETRPLSAEEYYQRKFSNFIGVLMVLIFFAALAIVLSGGQ